MTGYLVALLVGCAPQPTTIHLSGDPVAVVYNLEAVSLPEAAVLDAKGVTMSPTPVVKWTVEDPALASVDATSGELVPAGEGTAVVIATAGKATARWRVKIVIPDSIEITGATEGQTVPVGEALRLDAALVDAGQPITGQTITWTTSDPAVATVQGGALNLLAPGPVTITAAFGDVTDTLTIEAVPAAALTDAVPPEVSADI